MTHRLLLVVTEWLVEQPLLGELVPPLAGHRLLLATLVSEGCRRQAIGQRGMPTSHPPAC